MTIFKKLAPAKKEPIVVMDGEKLTIDQLKEVVADGFVVVQSIIALFSNFGTGPIFTILGIAAKYEKAGDVFRIAFEQFKDLDATEASELTEYVADKFDIEDDVLEVEIEEVLRIPARAFAAVESVQKVVAEVNAIRQDEATDGWQKADAFAQMAPELVAEVKYVVDFVKESISDVNDLFEANEPTA